MKLPSWFWRWAKWRDQGGIPALRPGGIPTRIPAWAWIRYAIHRASRRPTVLPFDGFTVFTAQDPMASMRVLGLAKRVLVRPDIATDIQIATLRQAGFIVSPWEADIYAGNLLGSNEYVAQAEGPDQLVDALRAADGIPPNIEKALVGEPPYADKLETMLFEAYQQDVPPPSYFSMHWVPVVDVVGFEFSNYIPSLNGRKDFMWWLIEEASEKSILDLRAYLAPR